MLLIQALEFLCAGKVLTGVFQTLSAGNISHPAILGGAAKLFVRGNRDKTAGNNEQQVKRFGFIKMPFEVTAAQLTNSRLTLGKLHTIKILFSRLFQSLRNAPKQALQIPTTFKHNLPTRITDARNIT
jgi:hypothetical protein